MYRQIFIMRAKFIFSLLISLIGIIGYCNNNAAHKLNLDFENIIEGKPSGWIINLREIYSFSLDSVTVKSGKYSICIESSGNSKYMQTLAFCIPNNYAGKKIMLSGYIKTENVTDGYAGLGIQLNPQNTYKNMQQNGVTGTTDWQRYEITLEIDPAETKQIIIGGLLSGKGKMWLDNLQVTIDGKDIKNADIYEKRKYPAYKDHEFDLGSNIIIPISKKPGEGMNKSLVKNLELLGRIWGFLKYHHPAIGKGDYNWDYELFRMLSDYIKTTSIVQRDKILLTWIEKYGEIQECKTCIDTPINAFLKPDLTWIENSNMNQSLKQKLKYIYQNRSQEPHFYIQNENNGAPIFLNENQYSNMTYPDAGFRLLTLYKYWNIINYFFPYKYLTDKNWNDVLKEYIPKFILAKTELEYELTTLLLIGEVNDTHAHLTEGGNKLVELKGNWQAPFKIRFIENKWVVTDYYKPELKETTGLNLGDIITHIESKRIESIVDSMKIYTPASNEAKKMHRIATDLLRSRNKTIRIKYITSNQKKEKDLILYQRDSLDMNKNYPGLCYKILKDNIGYINLGIMKKEDIDAIKKELMNTKGIIIDIRNSPSYPPVISLLGSCFVSKTTPFVKFTKSNPNNPGEFTFFNSHEIQNSNEYYHGKLVVIVNEETQSNAEYTAMAFRAGDNTTIIGSTTAGTDGDVAKIFLPGGIMTYISAIGVYYPDDTETQRIGIVPDIEVKPTIKGILEGRDELLEKAIEIVNNDNRAHF